MFGNNVEGNAKWRGYMAEIAVTAPYLPDDAASAYTADVIARWGIA